MRISAETSTKSLLAEMTNDDKNINCVYNYDCTKCANIHGAVKIFDTLIAWTGRGVGRRH